MSTPLSRRRALQLLGTTPLLAGSLASTLSVAHAADVSPSKPVRTGTGPRHSVCRWPYQKIPLADFITGVKSSGLESIELLDPEEWKTVQAAGLTCAVANGTTHIDQGFNRLENHPRFVPTMNERLELCARAGIPNVICFSGNRAGLGDEQGLENCVVGLKQIVGTAERVGVTIVMELLNSRVNHPDYMADRTAWGVELVKRVGSERFKLLYDIYHMQIMEGDLIATIQAHHECIGHYHTGGVPGRHEIDASQEINYTAVVRAIAATGYRGFIGQEFLPTGEPFSALARAVQICTVA